MLRFAHRVRLAGERLLDSAHTAADTLPPLARWQRQRLYRRAGKYAPMIAYTTPRGICYFVRPEDTMIGGAIVRDGGFDLHKVLAVLELLDQHSYPIEQLLDVGANIGTTTVEILHRVPGASAIALEPEPRNFEVLQHNMLANGLTTRVSAHRLAASDTDAGLQMAISVENHGDHRVSASDVSDCYGETSWDTVTVPSARLDVLMEEGMIDAASSSLIFIDVQGHEGHVFDGAPRFLAKRPAIAAEFWPYGLDRVDGRSRFISVMQSYARLFDVTSVPKEIDGAALPRIADELATLGAVMDLLALPE